MKLHGPTLKTGGGTLEEGRVLLETQIISAAATVDFGNLPVNTYPMFEIEFEDVLPATNDNILGLRVSLDNGATFEATTDYAWSSHTLRTDTTVNGVQNNDDEAILLSSNGAGIGVTNVDLEGGIPLGSVCLYNLLNSGKSAKAPFNTRAAVSYKAANDGRDWCSSRSTGVYNPDDTGSAPRAYGDINGIRLRFVVAAATDGGNITRGTFRLYGHIRQKILY